MVQCITKIRNLLNGTPTTQPPPQVESQTDVLADVLGGLIEEVTSIVEENDITFVEEKAPKPSKVSKVITDHVEPVKKRKTETAKEPVKKTVKPSAKEPVKKTVKPSAQSNTKPENKLANSNDRYGLLLTGLSEDQRATIEFNLQKLTKTSGNKPFKIIKDYSTEHVTHIICACAPRSHCPRTLKYLLGIAGKAWIVSFDWILESLEAGQVLNEDRFVVTGDEAVQLDTNACERSRADPNKLFDGYKFYMAGLFNAPGPTKADLTNLIQTAGGIVCKKLEEDVIAVSNNATGPKPDEMSYSWLFDSVSLYEIK